MSPVRCTMPHVIVIQVRWERQAFLLHAFQLTTDLTVRQNTV